MTFEEKIEKADELLNELIKEVDEECYDDCDGYWMSENTWCCRYLYYDKIAKRTVNAAVKKFNTKMTGLTFYCVQYNRADEEPAEIGYELEDLN